MTETSTMLVAGLQSVMAEVRASFSHLSISQLNWKQSPQQWSIGQCLDHLVTANDSYFPIFEKVLQGEHRATLWERFPLLPSLFGKVMIKSLSPQATRKMKAPQVFRPASSDIDEKIVTRFLTQQHRLIEYIKASDTPRMLETIITSPASSFVTYSLLDAYTLILVHERRHILQAQKVKAAAGFPNNQQPNN